MFTNEEIVNHVENIFLKPLSWRCITSVIVGRSQCYKEKAFYEKLVYKPTSQVYNTVSNSWYKKPHKHWPCDQCGKYYVTATVLKKQKFRHSRAKSLLQRKLSFAKKIPKHTSQVSHMFSHRGEDLKMQDFDRCGKYFIKSTALKIVPKPTSQVCNTVNQLMR